MTQYMLSVWHTDRYPIPESPEDMQRMFGQVDAVNAEMQSTGVWVFGGGLVSPESATVVRATKDADPVITDGPFAETKELMGGFWILELPDLDAALEWAVKAATACEGPVEVRPFEAEPSTD
jgi:hypothetical protein